MNAKDIDLPHEFVQLARTIPHVRNGILPEPGALNDQPATWLDAVSFVEGRIAQIERAENEKHRAMQKQPAAAMQTAGSV